MYGSHLVGAVSPEKYKSAVIQRDDSRICFCVQLLLGSTVDTLSCHSTEAFWKNSQSVHVKVDLARILRSSQKLLLDEFRAFFFANSGLGSLFARVNVDIIS